MGCGSNREKKLHEPGNKEWKGLVTLDINDDHEPDVIHDLEIFPYPFRDNAFDEIHAYEVLEHTGAQGDYRFFFNQFNEIYRILEPNGKLYCSVPAWNSMWAWGDPSHRRVIPHSTLVFLDQDEYKAQVGKTAMSDFRFLYHGDFKTEFVKYEGDNLWFVLRANKPASS